VSCEDEAGNSASTTAGPINIDLNNPTIPADRSVDPNDNNWHNTEVTVTFTCDDETGGSGVASCSSPEILGEGAEQSSTGNVEDLAGNTNSVTEDDINIDLTNPVVSITTPEDEGEYASGTAVPTDWTASDPLSGLDSVTATTPDGDPIDTTGLGAKSFNVTATDKAGNTTSVAHSYEVVRLEVLIDLRPSSINLGAKGVIPVAAFSGTYIGVVFDATNFIDSSLKFEGTGISHKKSHVDDLDGTGGLDSMSHYGTLLTTSLTESSVQGCLTGQTTGGIYFTGCDSIRIVPPDNSNAGGNSDPAPSSAGGNGKGKK